MKFLKWFLMTSLFFFLACEEEQKSEKEIGEITETNEETNTFFDPIKWGLSVSTIQLVTETVKEKTCPSGWTELFKKYNGTEKEELIPLQPLYVKRFGTLNDFAKAAYFAYSALKKVFPVIRFSLVWPCFENSQWQKEVLATITKLQEAGWQIELALSHHDSYPALLETPELATTGWANPKAPSEFEEYTEKIILLLKEKIPQGTVIYLINEPMSYLFNAYLGSGIWPPGGKKAGKTMAQALVNMRQGLFLAAKKTSAAGFKPALAQNIRPLLNPKESAMKSLDYIFNWWLLEALFHGCVDDDFNGQCEKKVDPAPIAILGLTFYGAMWAKEETIDFGLPGESEIKMALPEYDFQPNPQDFQNALKSLLTKFPEVEIGVAEIGFSASDVAKMISWLKNYRDVVLDFYHQGLIKNPFIQLHTLFKSAEFSPGDWVFHLIGECDEMGCEMTEWGKAVIEEILGQ